MPRRKVISLKVLVWTAALAFVGYAIAGKRAIEDTQAELYGLLIGAAIGFLIGWALQRYEYRRKHEGL